MGQNLIKRLISLFLRSLFGNQRRFKKIKKLENNYADIIIAINILDN